ncbi:transporter substrate-binding domain-containing protein [Pseudomonas sp. 681]|uniref:Transporter substrate-binding domain-containing protein n=1 Tax=Pseudomonas fungipugnans TaxID=3024217 RepID=A0ABT6QJK7_9PSED|nr:transporter substrate-binding domain-containing protein [Pseudomonas sp. 681]MDI2591065.1 transporter substrate-binding domain-containing protein [Pseudomonas sp. 681]
MKTSTGIRFVLSFFALVVLGTDMACAEDSLANLRKLGEIRIANTQSSPPWSYIDDQNKPTGYDIAIAEEVAKRIGVPKVVFIADSFANFVEGLKADKYDLVMNDLTPTPERALQVDFSDPYGVEEFRIFLLDKNTDIHERGDLAGKSAGVVAGSSNESWSRKQLVESDIRTYENGGLAFDDLANGRIDVVISSWFSGEKYRLANQLPIKAVGAPLTFQLSAAAMPKGHESLKVAVNKAIAEMIADGTIDAYTRKFIGPDYPMTADIKKAQAGE